MKRKLLWLVPVLLMAGCISAATIASYLPIFETAVNGVIALVKPSASAQVAADEAKVNVAVTDLVAAVNNIQGSKTVSAALSDVEAVATQLETDLGVSANKDVQLATAILDLAIGTYEAIIQAHTQSTPAGPKVAIFTEPEKTFPGRHENLVLAALNTPTDGAVNFASYPPQLSSSSKKVRPVAKSVGAFKRSYNALCKQYGHPEMQMKLSMAERLRVR